MRIDNPSISGSLSFIQGTNTISGTSVSLTGSLSGTFEGQFSGDSLSNISGAFDSVSSSLASNISLNASSIDSLNSASSSYALESNISGAFDSVSSSLASNISLNGASINSLNSASSSYLLNTTDTLDGDLTVTGTITGDVTGALSTISVTALSDVTSAGSGEIISSAERTQLQGSAAKYTVSVISTNTTGVKDFAYILTASLTLTLPGSPSVGNRVLVSNQSGTTTPIIARNGSLIAGLDEDLTLDVNNLGIQLLYSGATKGWIIL